MHMSDALLSPAVGGTMWAVSAGAIAYCSAKVRSGIDDSKVPLMGVLGAFLFAAQMINFTIPATGSSGHLGGGLLLTVLLGPPAAFLCIASVLVVQALFFADGGLLALGCNIFNMGFIPAFIVYPLIYRKILGNSPTQFRMTTALMISAMAGLQLAPFCVVLETLLSGISELPFSSFALLMQPIHLAIGFVEGLVTVSVVSFIGKARPEVLKDATESHHVTKHQIRNVLLAFLAATVVTGGILSWYASRNPDGLEWAIAKVSGNEELKGPGQGIYRVLSTLQEKTAFLPDYSFRKPAEAKNEGATTGNKVQRDGTGKLGTSLSGILGAFMTLAFIFLSGYLIKRRFQTA